jgi:drug/metabolite transporter (DMT)-like permease
MNSLGIVGGIVFVIGIIVILVSLYYRLDSGLNILDFIGIFVEILGVVMIVLSKKSETKQTPS